MSIRWRLPPASPHPAFIFLPGLSPGSNCCCVSAYFMFLFLMMITTPPAAAAATRVNTQIATFVSSPVCTAFTVSFPESFPDCGLSLPAEGLSEPLPVPGLSVPVPGLYPVPGSSLSISFRRSRASVSFCTATAISSAVASGSSYTA